MENIIYYALVFVATIIIPIFVAWLYLVPSQLALRKAYPTVGMLMILNIFGPLALFALNPQFSVLFWVVIFIWSVSARGQKTAA